MPSVFVSYASQDRDAARAIRDVLAAAGLEVWLDENELGGGDAWDAKIREQIRTCTYFMPIVSATTEARGEGYFRREWRLAVERTLDHADDVTFLVPVVIDDTQAATARVPERFRSIHWLSAPQGAGTRELVAVAERLARTDHTEPPAPALARKKGKDERPPYPLPHFPPFPESGNTGRFVYDVVVWGGRLAYAMWRRLPGWLRILAMVAIVFKLIDLLGDNSTAPRPPLPE